MRALYITVEVSLYLLSTYLFIINTFARDNKAELNYSVFWAQQYFFIMNVNVVLKLLKKWNGV